MFFLDIGSKVDSGQFGKKVTIDTGRDLRMKLDFTGSPDIGLLDELDFQDSVFQWISDLVAFNFSDIGKSKLDDTGLCGWCSQVLVWIWLFGIGCDYINK